MTAATAMDLVGSAGTLDRQDFEVFYAATERALRGYIRRVALNDSMAEDVLQESYVRLLTAPSMREDQRRAYLFRVATNLIMDQRRAQARLLRWWRNFPRGEQSSDIRPDLTTDMRHLFAKISVRERALLWLAYVEGAEHGEIAEILRVRQKSVKVLLHRARRRMEEILRRNGFEGSHE